MTSEDTIVDPLMSVQIYINSKKFSISCYSPSTVFFKFLLQKTVESVFQPHYESLKKSHDTNYLMTSEDTVEDPLMSFQFYKNNKSFFILCYSPSTVFFFIAKDAWICISTTLWIFKTKPWHKLFDDIWDTVEDPLMSVHFYIKSNSYIVKCYSPSTVFTFIAKEAWICISTTLWIFKTKP